jgi:hypothetical protein
MDALQWTEADMIAAACEHWGDGFEPGDCRVVRRYAHGSPCLVVLHEPTGRTSDEAGNGGRWHLDGRAMA